MYLMRHFPCPFRIRFLEDGSIPLNRHKICKESNENKIISESESSNHIKVKKNLVDKRYEGKWECFKYIIGTFIGIAIF